MKKLSAFLLLCVACHVSPVHGQEVEPELNASQKAFILSRFCTEVKYNFVHYNTLTFDWDSLCIAANQELTSTQSDDEFLTGLKRLSGQLQDGHTYVYAENKISKHDDWIRPFPMKTKRVGNRVFVTAVYRSDFEKQGLCYGCEILDLDGEPIIAYAEKHIRPYLASSTPQWSDYASCGEFALTKAKGAKVSTMRFRTPKGETRTIESNRNLRWDTQKNASAIQFKVVGKNIGLLTIDNFQEGNFKRELFDSLYTEIVKTDALIIDVRDNSGGNSSHADYIIRHFDDKPIQSGRWSSRMYIATHASWGYPQEWYMASPQAMNPIQNKTIYKKPVALLVNATTFSSAENFCVTFQGLNRGKIIGVKTGGSTGNPISIDLGFGIGCSICTRNEWDTAGKEFIGIGITPDIEAHENADIFLRGKDSVVEAALTYLNTELQ